MRIELLEPGEAIPRGRGYVGVGDANDEIFFPHVDSCCAVVGVFGDGAIIGGHIGAEWPGHGLDRAFSGQRVFSLMVANQHRVNATGLRHLVVVYPGGTGWTPVVSSIYGTWETDGFMDVNTGGAARGVDVLVTHAAVTVRDCKTNLTKTFQLSDDLQSETFPSG